MPARLRLRSTLCVRGRVDQPLAQLSTLRCDVLHANLEQLIRQAELLGDPAFSFGPRRAPPNGYSPTVLDVLQS
jgi:hypothetical protein